MLMQKIVTSSMIIVLVLWFSLIQAEQNPTVAVLNFESQSSQGTKYVQKAADLMINELSRMGINVVERKRLDAVFRERSFQEIHATPIGVDTPIPTAISIGKMVGADVIVLGTIKKLEVSQHTVQIGESTITRYNAVAGINIRAVNVQTGLIIFSDSETASAQTKSASVPDFDMGSKAPSVEGPLTACIQRLSKKFADKVMGRTRQKSSKPSIM